MNVIKKLYLVEGKVTNPEAYENHETLPEIGDVEWQFSDGPSGQRTSTHDTCPHVSRIGECK